MYLRTTLTAFGEYPTKDEAQKGFPFKDYIYEIEGEPEEIFYKVCMDAAAIIIAQKLSDLLGTDDYEKVYKREVESLVKSFFERQKEV